MYVIKTNYDKLADLPALSSSLDNSDMLLGGPFLVQLDDVSFIGTEFEIAPDGSARFYDNGRGIYITLPSKAKVSVKDAHGVISFGSTTYTFKPLTRQWLLEQSPEAEDIFPTDASVRDFYYQRLVNPRVGPRYMVTIDDGNVAGLYKLINNRIYARDGGQWAKLAPTDTELEDAEDSMYAVPSFVDLFDSKNDEDFISTSDVGRFLYSE